MLKAENRLIAVAVIAIAVGALAGLLALQQVSPPKVFEGKLHVDWSSAQTAQAPGTRSTELTIYSLSNTNFDPWTYGTPLRYNTDQGLALVKDKRAVSLAKGPVELSFPDVSAHIEPASVWFKDLTDAGTIVAEQNYRYDLVDQDRLLEKYVDKQITVQVQKGQDTQEIMGTLLSHSGGLVLKTATGIVSISGGVNKIDYPDLPEGLITKPTLSWMLNSGSAGNHDVEASYLSSGMGWEAAYVAVADSAETKVDMKGWVSVTNNMGTTFENAKLKLVAGDVNLVKGAVTPYRYFGEVLPAAAPGAMGAAQTVTRTPFAEYHLYDVALPTTLRDKETKQITLFDAAGVGVQKELVFDADQNDKVQYKLNFNNSVANSLGVPMPAGTVRVYKPDATGQLQFVGEDSIDHTAENEMVRLFLGTSFDVTGERTQTDFQSLGRCSDMATWKITLKNAKDSAAAVTVVEHPYSEWRITQSSLPYTKESQHKVTWKVQVPAKGSTDLTYTVIYSWC